MPAKQRQPRSLPGADYGQDGCSVFPAVDLFNCTGDRVATGLHGIPDNYRQVGQCILRELAAKWRRIGAGGRIVQERQRLRYPATYPSSNGASEMDVVRRRLAGQRRCLSDGTQPVPGPGTDQGTKDFVEVVPAQPPGRCGGGHPNKRILIVNEIVDPVEQRLAYTVVVVPYDIKYGIG